jgi:hypothetical protein
MEKKSKNRNPLVIPAKTRKGGPMKNKKNKRSKNKKKKILEEDYE